MRLSAPGKLNRLAKRITPWFSRIAAGERATGLLEFAISYFNLVIGKGAGSGWDRGEQAAAARVVRRSSRVILDLGANRGMWTTGLRARIGGSGRWILVDPAPECCAICRQIPDVEVIEAAVGERPGKAILYSPGEASGLASLHERRDSTMEGKALSSREVAVTTIDTLLEERAIEEVDLMKMDLEGHELFALRGAGRALKTKRIRALTFEFGASNVNSRTYFRDFWELLTGCGYCLERIYPGGRTVRIRRYYEDLEFFRGATNYIAVAAGD